MGVVVTVCWRGTLEGEWQPAGCMAKDWFENHALARLEFADDFVAGDEREADPVLEVGRCVPLDERDV